MSATQCVGIDVAKAVLDVAVRPSGETWRVANDDAGVSELVGRLGGLGAVLVVCEATGGFEQPVVAALAAARVPIVVANPRQVRDFARSTGQCALGWSVRELAGVLVLPECQHGQSRVKLRDIQPCVPEEGVTLVGDAMVTVCMRASAAPSFFASRPIRRGPAA